MYNEKEGGIAPETMINQEEFFKRVRDHVVANKLTEQEKASVERMFHVVWDLLQHLPLGGQDGEQTASKLASHLITHQDLLSVIHQQAAELDALKRITFNLTSNLDLQLVLDEVVDEAMRLVKNARDSRIFLLEDGGLVFRAALDVSGERNISYAPPRPNGMTMSVVRNKEMIIVEDTKSHPLFEELPGIWKGSMVGLPLIIRGEVIGVMNLTRTVTGPFSGDELRLLQVLADQAAVAILNARLHEVLSEQAMRDTLTGLPNRRALDQQLESQVRVAERYKLTFAVIMMDLDGFKTVNDTYGHDVGDQVLREIFKYIQTHLRGSDFLARYGGDELTLIMPQSDETAARQAGEKLVRGIAGYSLHMPDGEKKTLGISGGIAMYPEHGRTASHLLRAADQALYQAKKYSRGSFVLSKGVTRELPDLS